MFARPRTFAPLPVRLLLVSSALGLFASPLAAQLWVGPEGASASAYQHTTGNVVWFEAQSFEGGGFWVTGQVHCSGAVTGCTLVENPVWMGTPGFAQFQVSYSTGAAGTGTITVSASGGGYMAEQDAWYNVTVTAPPPPPVVTPDGAQRLIPPTTGTKLAFTVRNPGTTSRTYNLSATCTGAVTNCSIPGPIQVGAGQSRDVWPTLSVVGVTFQTGTLKVVASDAGAANTSDTGSVAVTVAPVGPVVDRGLCLTAAAGAGAAFECGDLRLTHRLPALRTLTTARAPVLLYNSQHAHPFALITADVTLPAGQALPTTVRAILWINGAKRDSTDWPGSAWGTDGQTRRVVQRWDADTFSTRLYDYRLELLRIGPGVDSLPSVLGQLAIVNRRASPFGPGWWLAGLERLFFNVPASQVLWVGGDGSVRLYQRAGVAATDTAYVATPVDRPDTLLHTAANEWARLLPGGGRVVFSSSGIHVRTTNRLGYTTTFVDSAGVPGVLARIELPPTSAGLSYRFAYGGTPARLVSVSAPDSAPGTWRITSLAWAGDSVRITDPGSPGPVTFRYQAGGTNRIVARKDRLGVGTSFTYDAGSRLATSKLGLGGADSINMSFCAAEVRGLAACSPTLVPPDSAYAIIDGPRTDSDGPRTDSADVHHFWVNRFGGPWKIRDPYGAVTTLAMGDPSWPALVTRLQHPNGWIQGATYDARGSLTASSDSSINATTRYQWDQRWDRVVELTLPTGEVTRFGYDAANGNRRWQEDGRGTPSRVTFEYYTSGSGAQLLRAIVQPGGARDSLAYDARGNVSLTRTPLGWETRFDNDRLGRTTVRSQLAGGQWRHDSTSYDQLDRVIRSVAYGQDGSPEGQRLIVRNFYDAEGRPDSLERSAVPDPASVGVLVTRWKYDAAGRAVAEYAPDFNRDSSIFDPAGNVVRAITRRGDTLTMAYDRLNRLRRRVLPPAVYDARSEGLATRSLSNNGGPRPYPWYTNGPDGELTAINDGDDGMTIRGDTASFTYDAMGNMLRADNRDAKVKRTYFANGRIETDSLRIRTYAGTDDTTHVYGVAYRYDLSGRLARLRHPYRLAPRTPAVRDSAYYEYDPVTGALAAVTDPLGWRFEFAYNVRNERIRLRLPGSIVDSSAYDLDGRLATSWIKNNNTSSPWKHPDLLLRHATIAYADAQRVALTQNTWGLRDTVNALYSGLGHLVELQYRLPANGNVGNTAQLFARESFTPDPFGNVYVTRDSTNIQRSNGWVSTTVTPGTAFYSPLVGQPATGRLRQRSAGSDQVTVYKYDDAGNTVFSTAAGRREDRAFFYGADGRLRVAEYRRADENSSDAQTWPWWETFEEYRYDALGRRVLVRLRRNCFRLSTREACRLSTIRRFVWEGARELYEIQVPGADWESASALENDADSVQRAVCQAPECDIYFDPNPRFGRVAYTYAGGVDQPLSIVRINYVDRPWDDPTYRVWAPFSVAPHWNWRGQAEYSTFGDGGAGLCVSPTSSRCVELQWRVKAFAFTQSQDVAANPNTFHTWAWVGTLLDLKEDGSGMQYRRNRYVDPATGRFTQEDPIGLAGGLNLYGFAGGDPVNFSDPFGLCPEPEKKNGTVCVALFIQRESVGGLRGDSRGFSSSSDPSQSRVFLHVDVENQTFTATVNPTCTTGGERAAPLSTNQIGVRFGEGGGFTVTVNAKNSILRRAPAINASFTFTSDGQGGFTTSGNRDAFPSAEAYLWRGGQPTTLFQRSERTRFHLFPFMPNDRWP